MTQADKAPQADNHQYITDAEAAIMQTAAEARVQAATLTAEAAQIQPPQVSQERQEFEALVKRAKKGRNLDRYKEVVVPQVHELVKGIGQTAVNEGKPKKQQSRLLKSSDGELLAHKIGLANVKTRRKEDALPKADQDNVRDAMLLPQDVKEPKELNLPEAQEKQDAHSAAIETVLERRLAIHDRRKAKLQAQRAVDSGERTDAAEAAKAEHLNNAELAKQKSWDDRLVEATRLEEDSAGASNIAQDPVLAEQVKQAALARVTAEFGERPQTTQERQAAKAQVAEDREARRAKSTQQYEARKAEEAAKVDAFNRLPIQEQLAKIAFDKRLSKASEAGLLDPIMLDEVLNELPQGIPPSILNTIGLEYLYSDDNPRFKDIRKDVPGELWQWMIGNDQTEWLEGDAAPDSNLIRERAQAFEEHRDALLEAIDELKQMNIPDDDELALGYIGYLDAPHVDRHRDIRKELPRPLYNWLMANGHEDWVGDRVPFDKVPPAPANADNDQANDDPAAADADNDQTNNESVRKNLRKRWQEIRERATDIRVKAVDIFHKVDRVDFLRGNIKENYNNLSTPRKAVVWGLGAAIIAAALIESKDIHFGGGGNQITAADIAKPTPKPNVTPTSTPAEEATTPTPTPNAELPQGTTPTGTDVLQSYFTAHGGALSAEEMKAAIDGAIGAGLFNPQHVNVVPMDVYGGFGFPNGVTPQFDDTFLNYMEQFTKK